ncbi:hypothetical protein AAFJ72_05240 [Brevibacillus gelatini]|uniref:hypothetical protein n=1 Tax=Brevibacillus gelatini TaxID=1655277 RepID=UPI003D813DD0
MTGYERIRVTAPYRIKRIEDVQMEWKPNEHARLYLRGIVDDSETVNAVLQAASDDEIRLYDWDGESETTIFKGVVTSVQIAHRQGVYAIELEGHSGSFQLDVTKKRRSFQQADMTYPKLVQEIIKTYPGYNVNIALGKASRSVNRSSNTTRRIGSCSGGWPVIFTVFSSVILWRQHRGFGLDCRKGKATRCRTMSRIRRARTCWRTKKQAAMQPACTIPIFSPTKSSPASGIRSEMKSGSATSGWSSAK